MSKKFLLIFFYYQALSLEGFIYLLQALEIREHTRRGAPVKGQYRILSLSTKILPLPKSHISSENAKSSKSGIDSI